MLFQPDREVMAIMIDFRMTVSSPYIEKDDWATIQKLINSGYQASISHAAIGNSNWKSMGTGGMP